MTIYYIIPDEPDSAETDSYVGEFGTGKMRNRWSDISASLAAGDEVYFASGQTHPGRCDLTVSGTATARIKIAQFGGSSRAIIDGQGTTSGGAAAFRVLSSYVDVSGIHGIGCAGASSGAGVCVFRGSHVTIEDCEGSGNQVGIRAASDSTGGNVTDIRIRRCHGHDNLYLGGYVTGQTGAAISDVEVTDSSFERNGSATNTDLSRGGLYVRTLSSPVATTNSPAGVRVLRNRVRFNRGYGIALSPALDGPGGNAVMWNEVAYNNLAGDIDAHAIWVGNTSDRVKVAYNDVHHNMGFIGQSNGSMAGIFLDQATDGTPSTYCEVFSNYIHDQPLFDTAAYIPNGAIYCFHTQHARIHGNIIARCRNGIVMWGGSTGDIDLYNNTLIDLLEAGMVVDKFVDGVRVYQNVVSSAQWAYYQCTGANAPTNVVHDRNIWHGGVAVANGSWDAKTAGTLGANESSVDPMLDDAGRIGENSPCRLAGTYAGWVRDSAGRRLRSTPDIGAWQYRAPMTSVTVKRSAVSSARTSVSSIRESLVGVSR